MFTRLVQLSQIVPALLGITWLIALASNPIAPCGPAATRPAATVRDHLHAMANHARAIAVLIARKIGAS
ncbi:hypothetical protein OG564_34380 [Streptomyces sp. NBC_01280]|uniref:hypothetical protein n=1 Tax=Streptomyces sp. NBC_01280 TaxID=2903810 RepID=UPI002E32593C|nr:hypothetical protein [Streptomyces sp. NBC_01280]WSE14135.1 hypothetical protein OG518_12860 [Streptomyces sp. NBC_01397]